MSVARHRRITELFCAARLLDDVDIDPFLEKECGGDVELRQDVQALLKADIDDGFLGGTGSSEATPPPDIIGPYRILKELGEGGMGIVYLAQQSEPVRRKVALKLVKPGLDTRAVLGRFDLERQALSMMDHPFVARVLDGGGTADGRPYFVMDLISGVPITEFCDERELDVNDRLRLFVRVCAGVEHAHQRGIIHRDLKPANILVARVEGETVPKIIDFGLARAMGQELVAPSFTQHGELVGTPCYMSPEQAGSDGKDVDTRSDIYSLGVVLYELLISALPLSKNDLKDTPLMEMSRKIRSHRPDKPSSKLLAMDDGDALIEVLENRSTSRSTLLRILRRDLDLVVMTAMAKERDGRYQAVHELATDIERYLENRPVLASPPSVAYRIRKVLQRHRRLAIASALVCTALCVGGGFAIWFAVEAARESALRKQLALVSLPLRFETAAAEAASLMPAWPERSDEIFDWLNRWRAVESERGALDELLREYSRGQRDVEVRDATMVDKSTRASLVLAEASMVEFFDERGLFARMQVEHRWAGEIKELTRRHPRATVSWDAARLSINLADGIAASDLYSDLGVRLRPQIGLVPIGMNPVTKLWEFYHLRSAWDPLGDTDPADLPIPRHRGEGEDPGGVDVLDATGVVFVLMPGGESADGTRVAPFFVARHELTQGQWVRLSGGRANPSRFRYGLHHPVEQIDPVECVKLLRSFGLAMPTVAQWTFADRAGAPTLRFRSDNPEGWRGFANVLDQVGAKALPWLGGPFRFSDGFGHHSPVGSFCANPFGLYDTCGNVWEMVVRQGGGFGACGGSYSSSPPNTRGGVVLTTNRWEKDIYTGIRAVRALRQDP